MADLHFKCCGCGQSLVVDEAGVGLEFQCPHCGWAQQIPDRFTIQANADPVPAPAPGSAAAGRRPAASPGLWSAQERIWQNERQSTEQAITLVEREQRISALTAERDWLAGQLEEERQRRQALEPQLDRVRTEWAAAEKRATEFEAGFTHNGLHLERAQADLEHLGKQLDILKGERSGAVMELAAKQEQFAELSLQLEKAVAARAELEQIAARARAEQERRAQQLTETQAQLDQLSAEADGVKAELARVRAELGLAVAQRDKFQAVVKEDPELADYVEARDERDRLEGELKETQGRVSGLREKVEELTGERDLLRRERTDLQLKIAALRDASQNAQLEQDNEMLRRMVERLNEEIKEFHPAIAKRKRRADAGGLLGEMAKGAISRCFVDPDAT